MKLEVKKTLTGGIFSIDVYFKAYEVFEEGLMEDFGTPELTIPVSDWTADFRLNGGALVIDGTIDRGTAKACDIAIEKEIKVKMDPSFKVSYEVKIADLTPADQSGIIDSLIKVAETRCTLFVGLIQREAKKEMDKLRALKTEFETSINNPEIIKV